MSIITSGSIVRSSTALDETVYGQVRPISDAWIPEALAIQNLVGVASIKWMIRSIHDHGRDKRESRCPACPDEGSPRFPMETRHRSAKVPLAHHPRADFENAVCFTYALKTLVCLPMRCASVALAWPASV
jgi:hypothetical protein